MGLKKEQEAFLRLFNNMKINRSLVESLCLFLVCFINRAATARLVD